MELSLSTKPNGGITVIEARGEIDVYTAPRLNQVLQDAIGKGARFLALDLTNVTFLDSTGLSILIKWQKQLAEGDGRLVIAGASSPLAKIFKVTGLEELFRLYSSQDQAVAALRD